MSITLNKNKSFGIPSSPLKVEEYAPILIENKQGIVSILQEPDRCHQTKAPNATTSLERTLSADMSSKKWLAQNGMKNTASLQHFSIQGEQDEFKGKREVENPSQLDVWSSILSKKSDDKEVESPYVHPLVKRSSSSLSKKSLQICTESLGSETSSEGFPSYPSSETGDAEEKPKPQTEQGQVHGIANYCYSDAAAADTKKPRTFPPPIPSLQMHSHRESGRLVLEASLFPPNNFFQTQRRDGRLLLTLLDNQETLLSDQEKNKVFDKFQQEKEENEIAEEVEGSQNLMPRSLSPKSPAASANGFKYA